MICAKKGCGGTLDDSFCGAAGVLSVAYGGANLCTGWPDASPEREADARSFFGHGRDHL